MKIDLGHITLNVREEGTPSGQPVVFSNSLGTSLELWDDVVARLPENLRVIRYDMRGHGASDVPPAPYSMGALIRDAEMLLDRLEVRDCLFVGLSIGGMIGQGLATKRLDQIRALVLSNTAPKMGTKEMWGDRIATLEADGLDAMADAIMERWFSRGFTDRAPWRKMLTDTPQDGYAGACAAIAGTDFFTQTAALTLPALVIAGSEDGASPPDMVRELAELMRGARFELIRRAGHLPCVEQPDVFAEHLTSFLRDIGHL